jgi:flagellar protein FlaI
MFSKNKSNGKRNGAADTTVGGNGNSPAKSSGLGALFAKKTSKELSTIYFDPGYLSDPSMEGALRDVDVTYPVDPPFQYVQIRFDQDEGSLRYRVLEPELSPDELQALTIVEQGFEKIISTNLDLITGENRETYLQDKFLSIMKIFGIHATEEQKARMFFHLKKQYLGYSRMDTLMKDKYIEDISCNGSGIFFYVQHRIYGSVQTDVKFGEVELNNFVLRLAQLGGRHISLLQPIRDVTLPDGSRANITLGSEVTKKGSTFTIRKFRSNPISPIEMMEYGSIDAQQLAFLWLLMEYKRSILVSGGTATGKTTLLNVLCAFIPDEYKIVSIEDTAELNLMHPNWVQSVTRTGFGAAEGPSSASGISGVSRRAPGDIALYDLLVAALRQRPEFIIVGEVRGDEAFTLFQAIAVGHAALGTIHAGSMNELMARIESNPMNVPRSLFSNLDAVIFPMHIKKGERSMRRLANITEVLELDRDTGDLLTNTVYKWLPEQDTYKYQGRSYLLDRIRDIYGVSKDLLKAELVDRTRFLLWMRDQGVREYDQVTRLIRHYYRDKQAVMEQMNRDEGVRTLLLEPEPPVAHPAPVAARPSAPVDDLLE